MAVEFTTGDDDNLVVWWGAPRDADRDANLSVADLLHMKRDIEELKREVAALKHAHQPLTADAVGRTVEDRLIDIFRRYEE